MEERVFSERDKLLEEFETYTAPIRASIAATEESSGSREIEGALYPDIQDSSFLSKLLRKREFRETQQPKITDKSLKDNVCEVQEFEYTPVQKFVAQFMSPDTPYNGMLLYHGVGVGKTCTAILTAEVFLELSPKNKVYILAPPAIQPGFYRTIFDISRVKFGVEDDEPNQHEGCTGNRYLELTQTQFERDPRDIELRVNRLINKRYSILGYVAFRNMVRAILKQVPSTLTGDRKRQQETRLLRKALSGCLFIVDEAHNMRDIGVSADSEDSEENQADDPLEEKGDAAGGKKLTPYLRKVLKTCEGNKLLLMSATPMYNTYKEIVSLLNLLLLVDHADESDFLKESDIQFQMTETGEQLTAESESKILRIANGHISFMRGENPKAFPARLDPSPELRITTWPSLEPNGLKQIEPAQQKDDVMRLPLVKCELSGDSLTVIQTMSEKLIAEKGVGIRTIDTLLQAGNCIFPAVYEDTMDGRVGSQGFKTWFAPKAVAARFEGTRLTVLPQYTPAIEDGNYIWMSAGRNTLGKASPKFNQILQTIKRAAGISFIYSRFVENGAVLFCLLLEANGYTAWGRSAPLFSKGPVTAGGRQCAKCDKREVGHSKDDKEEGTHAFTPAYYALLTASAINTPDKQSLPLSPNNPKVITVARDNTNADGSKIKVIVGSQVAGEGLDLRAIREVHILEGWFHLSKEEQIIGRGIRYCSHQALDYKYRNCTINLYVNVFPPDVNKETIDQYSYRTAMNKAVRMGNVSRALRQGAADCNLNREAILVNGLSEVDMIDSQGVGRKVNLNDRDFTSICDWIRCSYECKPSIDIAQLPDDNSTYDMYAARFAEQTMILKLKRLFKEQVWFRWEDIQKIFQNIPKSILISLLLRIVGNPSIVFENGTLHGHIIYRNNLFIFQPNVIQDQAIPLALRYGRYPIKRDSYQAEKLIAPPTGTVRKITTTKPLAATIPASETVMPSIVEASYVPEADTLDEARELWTEINTWLDSWAKDDATAISEDIPPSLTKAILTYVGDLNKKDNIEARLKKLQWWGRSIIGVENGLRDLRLVARQFIWDSFLKGREQIAFIHEGMPHADEAGNEQSVVSGSTKAQRYLALDTKEPVYICDGSPCSPAILQLFTRSVTDPIINVKANQRVTAELYGFMVPWENAMMFKTNTPKPEGKDPGGGAACSIVSNVSGHRKKIVDLGQILAQYNEGQTFDLTDEKLTVTRKLTGAPNFCALMEIILRWMDVRKEMYGSKRFFYRPLSSYYSKHRSKK